MKVGKGIIKLKGCDSYQRHQSVFNHAVELFEKHFKEKPIETIKRAELLSQICSEIPLPGCLKIIKETG